MNHISDYKEVFDYKVAETLFCSIPLEAVIIISFFVLLVLFIIVKVILIVIQLVNLISIKNPLLLKG